MPSRPSRSIALPDVRVSASSPAASSSHKLKKDSYPQEDHATSFERDGDDLPQYTQKQSAADAQAGKAWELLRKKLAEYDLVILVDDSGSMRGEDIGGVLFDYQTNKKSRWYTACEAVSRVADRAILLDDDGVDICFMNNIKFDRTVRTKADVQELERDLRTMTLTNRSGAGYRTPLISRLECILKDYFIRLHKRRREIARKNGKKSLLSRIWSSFRSPEFIKFEKLGMKKINLLIITDGQPNPQVLPDKRTTHDVITEYAGQVSRLRLPKNTVGIQFIQVGDDAEAYRFLSDLDNKLKERQVVDIVDTVPYKAYGGKFTAELLFKTFLGGIDRDFDREFSEVGIRELVDRSLHAEPGPFWVKKKKKASEELYDSIR